MLPTCSPLLTCPFLEIAPQPIFGSAELIIQRGRAIKFNDNRLVIIDDFNFITMAIAPDKTDSPPIVDPNRVLPPPIASQRFQLISGRRGQNM